MEPCFGHLSLKILVSTVFFRENKDAAVKGEQNIMNAHPLFFSGPEPGKSYLDKPRASS